MKPLIWAICLMMIVAATPYETSARNNDHRQRRDNIHNLVQAMQPVSGNQIDEGRESEFVTVDRGLINDAIFKADSPYRIGPGDRIRVSVYGQEEFSSDHLVGPDGAIMLPVFGRITINNMTQEDAVEAINLKLREMFIEPQTIVQVLDFRNNYCYILGRITNAGKYSFSGPPTLLELLTLAGGVKPLGGKLANSLLTNYSSRYDKAIIVRGRDQLIEVDLDRLLRDGRMELNLPLIPGDIVNIPESSERVTILGQIGSPGMYNFEPGMTLLQLVSIAGNTLPDANMKRIRILRGKLSNPTVLYRNLADAMRGGKYNSLELQSGDFIYVPKRGSSKFQYTWGWIGTAVSAIFTGDSLVRLIER